MEKTLMMAVGLLAVPMGAMAQAGQDSSVGEAKTGWYVGVSGGIGLTGGESNLSPFGMDYRKNYKNGRVADVQAGYRWSRFWSAGLRFNQLWASANYDVDAGNDAFGYADDVKVSYIAPQIGVNLYSGKRAELWLQGGVGYMHYRSEGYGFLDGSSTVEKMTVTSSSPAFNGDFRFDYKLTDFLYLNATVTALYANGFKKNKYKYDGDTKETIEPEDYGRLKLWRTDFSLGLTFKF